MSKTDFLNQRVRDGMLLDAYGPLLTEKQRLACEMVLLQDLSLAEASEALGVSRQGVHDLITRAKEHMENTERLLGLLEKEDMGERMAGFLDANRERLPEDFYLEFKKMLESYKGIS